MAMRESVPIDDDLHREIRDHPETFGLSDRVSKARRLAQLLALGADVARRRTEAERRQRAFAEWAEDEERTETVEMMRRVVRESGLV